MQHSKSLVFTAIFAVLLVASYAVPDKLAHLVTDGSQLPEYTRGQGNYSWVLSWAGRQGGIMPGPNERLRAALQRLKNGKKLHVSVIGGSITAGNHIKDGFPWPQYLSNYLVDHYNSNVEVANGAVSGTRSSYVNACHEGRISDNADVVIIEYTFNDKRGGLTNATIRTFERLIRKALNFPNRPAVILAHTIPWVVAEQPNWMQNFHETAESDYFQFVQYYQLPFVSLRSCCFKLLLDSSAVGFSNLPRGTDPARKGVSFFSDEKHLDGLTGSRVMAELLMQLFDDTYRSLTDNPLTAAEEKAVAAALPAPLLENNFESLHSQCFVGDRFTELITNNNGFEWINESPQTKHGKWGWISKKPGDYLEAVIDTRGRPELAAGTSDNSTSHEVLLLVAHLKSYQHMGKIRVECVEGCACAAEVVDGHSEQRSSQMYFHRVVVSQAEKCKLRMTVMDETSSGEYKAKIIGIVISEEAKDFSTTAFLSQFLTSASGKRKLLQAAPATATKRPSLVLG